MMLIDADALNWWDGLYMKGVNNSGVWVRYRDVKEFINSAQTIDAVTVVRCKDCYYSTDHPFINNTIDCDMLNITVDENFYCKFGITADDFARMDGDTE